MSDKALFFISIGAVFVALFAYAAVKSGKGFGYFKDREGRGAAASAALFMAILGGAVLLFGSSGANAEDEGKWLDYGKVYMGVDYTKQISPQCKPEGPDTHLTSNGGFEVGIYSAGRFESYAKITHHSCAISPDAKSYNAGGFGFGWYFW